MSPSDEALPRSAMHLPFMWWTRIGENLVTVATWTEPGLEGATTGSKAIDDVVKEQTTPWCGPVMALEVEHARDLVELAPSIELLKVDCVNLESWTNRGYGTVIHETCFGLHGR